MNKFLPLLGVALLSGCSLIPDYLRPTAPVPAEWSAPTRKVDADSTLPAVSAENWRSFFTEPQLQTLIEAALAHNRDLKIALARVDEARALSGVAHADRFPTLDTTLQQTAARVPADLSSSGQSMLTRRYDANLGITAFELDFWGRVKSLDAAAQASYLASDYAQSAFRLSLIADVASGWYSLIELDARLKLAEATLKSRAESRTLIERRRDVGLATDLDYLAADGAYQNARAETANLARQRAAAENALRLLVGEDASSAAVSVSPASTFTVLPEIAAGLPADVLQKRPDVLAAEQKLIAANANIGAARAAFFPKIALTALAGSASPALSGLFGGGTRAWSFVPVLKWPLFDGDRSESNVDLAKARKNIAVAEYEKAVQQAFRETADLLAARTFYTEQAAALAAAETAQNERLKRVEARYQAGVSSYLELLDAQREAFTAQQASLAAQRAVAATGAALFKALGGV